MFAEAFAVEYVNWPNGFSNTDFNNITKTCPCKDTETFEVIKNENFQQKIFDMFLIFALNIDCGYTLEPPR